jgi:hypothetical protein
MRRFAIYATLLVASVSLCSRSAYSQEDKSKRPSPPAHVEYKFPDGKMLTIDYSSPRMRGRVIYGGLVPYGTEWRVGANEATTFVSDSALNVGGAIVPPGSYTIFALPNPDGWKLIISGKTGEWGIPYPGDVYDFVRVDMKTSALPSPLEDFTIGLDPTDAGCTLRLDWETTRESVDITETKIPLDRRY